MINKYIFCVFVIFICEVMSQSGPDPWHYNDYDANKINDQDIPPDLKLSPRKTSSGSSNLGVGEWFFRRLINIVLKGGQLKINEDESVDSSLQLKFNKEQWKTLNEYMGSSNALTEDMYRRSIGYIEQAVYEPTITDKIVMAWSDYVEFYLVEYKVYITWGLAGIAISVFLIWLWSRMSHRHFVILVALSFYLYEVFTSYKEAEQQELDTFLSAVNSCKWYFWASSCTLPKPNPLIFIKHMNPLKIALRMFTTMISEPMIGLSATTKAMLHGITDGLWAPFDTLVYGILLVIFNAFLLVILITILFNYILNIPFNLGFCGISLGLAQRDRNLLGETQNIRRRNSRSDAYIEANERVNNSTFDKMLDVLQQALHNGRNNDRLIQNNIAPRQITSNTSGLRRSASTGRLPIQNDWSFDDHVIYRRRNVRRDGSGDA